MTEDRAEGLPVEARADTAAANEEFTGTVIGRETTTRANGWDPYEVWRTRVRAPSGAARTRKGNPRDLKR